MSGPTVHLSLGPPSSQDRNRAYRWGSGAGPVFVCPPWWMVAKYRSIVVLLETEANYLLVDWKAV